MKFLKDVLKEEEQKEREGKEKAKEMAKVQAMRFSLHDDFNWSHSSSVLQKILKPTNVRLSVEIYPSLEQSENSLYKKLEKKKQM